MGFWSRGAGQTVARDGGGITAKGEQAAIGRREGKADMTEMRKETFRTLKLYPLGRLRILLSGYTPPVNVAKFPEGCTPDSSPFTQSKPPRPPHFL